MNKPDNATEDERLQEEYYNRLNDHILNQSNNLDRSILTLSSGAVGLIVSTTNSDISDNHITFSLLFFTLSIISILSSNYCSIKAHRIAVININRERERKESISFNFWDNAITFLTSSSIATFAIAVILLLWTRLVNLIY